MKIPRIPMFASNIPMAPLAYLLPASVGVWWIDALACGVPAFGLWQVYRFQTRFYPGAFEEKDGLSVVISRRFWFGWPAGTRHEAKRHKNDELISYDGEPVPYIYVDVIPSDAEDAEERMVNSVLRAKELSKQLCSGYYDSDISKLAQSAQKLLKG